MKPAARSDLAVRELEEEAVVYDFRRNKAHCLNRTALAVFRLCNGERTPAQIARALSRELGTRCDEELIWMALVKLDKEQLLATPLGHQAVDFGRRRLLRKMAMTAGLSIALPAVWSILAPTPAYAASAVSCFPSDNCMSANSPTGCCNNDGVAGTCSVSKVCGGTNSSCNGQTCG